ncbi:MAG: ABC transporter permease [Bacillati bacterium ANGP1]|uniref:ABC transporter permease n=1 Tax=Candidatus Segetimicrobium genomatis TaxID=2569760 RepID=A0A537M799_9BACT|nr:MAG: ABC transporter permease [Terrabacteria group bacterium ANGP1]
MARFIVRRLVSVVPVLLLVAVFAFFLVHLTPGDPAAYMLGPLATPAQIDHLREALNLNVSLPIQFERWFLGALQGNLGESLFMSIPVPLAIWQRTEPTFLLTLMAVAIEVLIGVSAGVVAATRRNTWVDQLAIAFTSLGLSIPSFWLGLNLIFFFGVNLRVLPVAGYVPLGVSWIGAIRSLLMPACALGFISSALVARMTRASMLEVLSQDFVRTARAKGVAERGVIWRHALRNAILPVITVVGNSFAILLGGLVVTEQVFAIPGVGLLVIHAVLHRDYPVIQGVLLYIVTLYVFINVGMDIVYALVDPRIKFG